MDETAVSAKSAVPAGPPAFDGLDHVSVPCRDLEEGIRFYRDVLGGTMLVREGAFAMFDIGGSHVGIGSAGCTFIGPGNEYPHFAFTCGAEALVRMKEWLAACGVPSSGLWTRQGVEALMFFRDPSGNVIELYCHEGPEGSADLPRGPARGHGTAVDIDALVYEDWRVPGA